MPMVSSHFPATLYPAPNPPSLPKEHGPGRVKSGKLSPCIRFDFLQISILYHIFKIGCCAGPLLCHVQVQLSTVVRSAGVAVSSMMFGTTVLMFLVMLIIWETNVFLATAFLLFFGFIDMVYTSGKQPFVMLAWKCDAVARSYHANQTINRSCQCFQSWD